MKSQLCELLFFQKYIPKVKRFERINTAKF